MKATLLLAFVVAAANTVAAQEYILVTSDSSCDRITTISECDAAASALNLHDTKPHEFSFSYYPPGCFITDNFLVFNSNGGSTASCAEKNQCLCKADPCVLPNKYLGGCPDGGCCPDEGCFESVDDAKAECLKVSNCGGITLWSSGKKWELRKGTDAISSPGGEMSMLRACFG